MTNAVLDGLADHIGDATKALKSKEQMDANVRFALEHLEEWRREHPNKWVAVYDHKLVATASSKGELVGKLHEAGVPLREVYVDFISEEKSALML